MYGRFVLNRVVTLIVAMDILWTRPRREGRGCIFIFACRTQEIHVCRNAKSNELAMGMEDKVQYGVPFAWAD
ncbi:protein translocase subunit TIM44 [Apiospora arundinis]